MFLVSCSMNYLLYHNFMYHSQIHRLSMLLLLDQLWNLELNSLLQQHSEYPQCAQHNLETVQIPKFHIYTTFYNLSLLSCSDHFLRIPNCIHVERLIVYTIPQLFYIILLSPKTIFKPPYKLANLEFGSKCVTEPSRHNCLLKLWIGHSSFLPEALDTLYIFA